MAVIICLTLTAQEVEAVDKEEPGLLPLDLPAKVEAVLSGYMYTTLTFDSMTAILLQVEAEPEAPEEMVALVRPAEMVAQEALHRITSGVAMVVAVETAVTVAPVVMAQADIPLAFL